MIAAPLDRHLALQLRAPGNPRIGFSRRTRRASRRSRAQAPSSSERVSTHDRQGFSSGDWSSFPSGHTTTAFAVAAAVTNETERWQPHAAWIVGPLMYIGATSVGLSRMYHSRHWGSDVAIGAAIGTFSGRKITQYAHGHADNRLDHIILRTSAVPDGHGGVLLAYSLPTP